MVNIELLNREFFCCNIYKDVLYLKPSYTIEKSHFTVEIPHIESMQFAPLSIVKRYAK